MAKRLKLSPDYGDHNKYDEELTDALHDAFVNPAQFIGKRWLGPIRIDSILHTAAEAMARHSVPLMTPGPALGAPDLMAKRVTDILGASLGILLLWPLLLVVAFLIKQTSKGPVLFKQARIGKNGRPFTMYKFRSMVVDAPLLQKKLEKQNEAKGPVFKIRNDPRVTSIGRFIRAYSIDELPQLFNVLKGDMSLVGPRPPILKEVMQYQPWQRRRLAVTPGLTCIWQTSGRSNIGFDEWMRMDLQYIDNWSYWLDIRLILKTVMTVLKSEGAY